MAQRFGGKYSPGGARSTSGAAGQSSSLTQPADSDQVNRAGRRANVLFAPAVVLAVLSINEGAVGLATGLVGAAMLGLGAWLTRDGLRAHAAYDSRKIARRPALPRKIIGAVTTGLGLTLASLTNDPSVMAAVIYGLTGGVLHLMAFGVDPLRDKRMEGVDTFQQDRVAKVVDEAESYLAAMSDHIASVGDRHLKTRVDQFQTAARRMIRTVEEDPRDLTGARKFLGVYLMGARDAAAKFADLYKRERDEAARAEFEALLTDLEQNFAARTDKMLLDDKSDMEIEIKVLRDRLQRDGLQGQ